MTFKRMLLGTVLTTSLVMTGGSYALASDEINSTETSGQPADQEAHHKHHHKHHVKLTDEQKAALQKAGVDLKTLKENEHQLRSTIRSIHEQGQALKDAAKDNEALQKQLKADMEPIKTNFGQLRDLRKANHELKQALRDAATANDTVKMKDTYVKLVANQKQALQLLQTIDAQMKAEVKKIKG